MKVLLTQPDLNGDVIGPRSDYLVEPMALELLSANLSRHDVFLSDLRVKDDLTEKITTVEPDVVGITCCAMTEVPVCRALATMVKGASPLTRVVLGGQHPTFAPEDFLGSGIDYIVFGEGEITFAELLDVLERDAEAIGAIPGLAVLNDQGVHVTPSRPYVCDLDCIALPDRSLAVCFKQAYYKGRDVATVLTSRGCPYRCSFCTSWKFFGGSYRQRSPESVFQEIEGLDADMIHIADDTFLYDVDWSWSMLNALRRLSKPRRYKFWVRGNVVTRNPDLVEAWSEIGLDTACIGLESCDPAALARMRKGMTVEDNDNALNILSCAGVDVVPNFIVSPSFGAEDFDELASYVRQWGFSEPVFTVLTPLAGTDLYEEMKGCIVENRPEKYDLVHPVVPTKLTRSEFMTRFFQLYEEFYFGSQGGRETRGEEMPHFIEHRSVGRVLRTYASYNDEHRRLGGT